MSDGVPFMCISTSPAPASATAAATPSSRRAVMSLMMCAPRRRHSCNFRRRINGYQHIGVPRKPLHHRRHSPELPSVPIRSDPGRVDSPRRR